MLTLEGTELMSLNAKHVGIQNINSRTHIDFTHAGMGWKSLLATLQQFNHCITHGFTYIHIGLRIAAVVTP